MDIPAATHPCWQRLAVNQVPGFVPRQLSLQFLFTRLSHENIAPSEKARQIHAFFERYHRILAWELSELQRLHVL